MAVYTTSFDLEFRAREDAIAYFAQQGPDPGELTIHGNIKREETKAKALEEARGKWFEKLIDRLTFDPDYGEIITIAAVSNNQRIGESVRSIDEYPDGEVGLLRWFWGSIVPGSHQYVTHNGYSCDAPYLVRRSIIQRVKRTGVLIGTKYQTFPMLDILLYWTNHDLSKARGKKLTEVARVLGIDVDTSGHDGADIRRLSLEGRWDEIRAKCLDDARLAYRVFERISESAPAERR